MDIAGEIERLDELRRTGVLSDDEFQQAKEKVLAGGPGTFGLPVQPGRIHGLGEQTWCMLMHLSQLMLWAGGIGIAVPIVMWVISKDDSDLARRHGARMMNWLISSFVYGIICGLLAFVVIGIPMLIVLLVLNIVFPVMAAIRANDGQLWSYPMAIQWFVED